MNRSKGNFALIAELMMESRVFYLSQLTYVLLDCLMGEIFPELKEVFSRNLRLINECLGVAKT